MGFFVSAAGGKEDPIVLASQKSLDVFETLKDATRSYKCHYFAISKKIDTFIFGERAFNTKCPKLGKISPAKTLSNVTNSSISENPQFSRVSGCCEFTRMILDSFSISIPRKTTLSGAGLV